jgi:hypothetical protein
VHAFLVGATVDFVLFERQLQDEQLLSIREGQYLQLCVAVISGSLPYEELFTISTVTTDLLIASPGRKKRGSSLSPPASMT